MINLNFNSFIYLYVWRRVFGIESEWSTSFMSLNVQVSPQVWEVLIYFLIFKICIYSF